MAKTVPDGWFEYTRYKDCIEGTRIMATKTPLKEKYNTGRSQYGSARGVPLEEEFTPIQLVEGLQSKGLQLGLVIDITNTNRYYDGQVFEDLGIKYFKIKSPGHVIPPDSVYEEFSRKVKTFLSQNRGIVAVHCTHGINRTGYLVSRYLIENCGYEANQAVKAFETARGHKIDKKEYIEHLQKGCPKTVVSQDREGGRGRGGRGRGRRGRGAAYYSGSGYGGASRFGYGGQYDAMYDSSREPHEDQYDDYSYQGYDD